MKIQTHMLNSLIVAIQPAALAHYHFTAEILYRRMFPLPRGMLGACVFVFISSMSLCDLITLLLYLFLANFKTRRSFHI